MKTTKLFWTDEMRPASPTLWTVGREGGPLACQPYVITGPVRIGRTGPMVPPELLARTIPLFDDPEAQPWR